MDERLSKIISTIKSWEDLKSFEFNAAERNQLTEELTLAINKRATTLAAQIISEKTGLDLTDLSPAEEKIVQVVSDYVSIMKKQGKYPGRTLEQLKNRGLIGSAEVSVCKYTPTLGFKNLADFNHEELSYEQIVLEHPTEFSQRAIWFSRRTLGLPNDTASPPSITVTNNRNPAWSRDELILALDLYLNASETNLTKESPEVLELSEFLHQMGKVLGLIEGETYRNTNGVYMKLMNFRRFDSKYINDGKVGLTRGNKDEQIVWNEFSSNPLRLSAVAKAIRLSINQHNNDQELASVEPDIQEAEEGRVLTRMHRIRERSKKLVDAKKKQALNRTGKLCCEACGFDFSVKYGATGVGLIDVHHTNPIHTLTQGGITKLEDLALVCANCHRVIHSSRKWLTIEQVRDLIKTHK